MCQLWQNGNAGQPVMSRPAIRHFGTSLFGFSFHPHTALNQSKLSSISGSMVSASSAVTVAAGKTVDFTVTFPVPDGCNSIPFFAYVRSTGWAGVVPQGIIVSKTKNEATFTLYNASTVSRTITPQCVALFYKR